MPVSGSRHSKVSLSMSQYLAKKGKETHVDSPDDVDQDGRYAKQPVLSTKALLEVKRAVST